MACATVSTPAPRGRIIGGYAHPETRRFHLLHAFGETDHCPWPIRPTIFRILRVGDAVWRELPLEDTSADPVTHMIIMLSTYRNARMVRLHNNLHWLVRSMGSSGTTVRAVRLLAFDTRHEKLWSMKTLERHGRPLSLMTTRIGVLPCGKLCIFAVEPSSSSMETWVLEDYSGGPRGTWQLKDRISLVSWDGCDLSQEFYMDNQVVAAEDPREGEEVLLKQFGGRLDAYNSRRKAWRTVDLLRINSVISENLLMHGESLLQGQVCFGNANLPLYKYIDWYGQRLYCL